MDKKEELMVLAITEEIKAQKLYRKLHEIVDSEAAKGIFLRLIKIEELHEHKIKKLLNKEFPDHSFEFIPDKEYQAELKQKLNSTEDVYGFAIAKEQKAEAIYKLTDQLNFMSEQMRKNTERRRNAPVRNWGDGRGYQPYRY